MPNNHKYVQKVKDKGGNYRYFYSNAEFNAYMQNKRSDTNKALPRREDLSDEEYKELTAWIDKPYKNHSGVSLKGPKKAPSIKVGDPMENAGRKLSPEWWDEFRSNSKKGAGPAIIVKSSGSRNPVEEYQKELVAENKKGFHRHVMMDEPNYSPETDKKKIRNRRAKNKVKRAVNTVIRKKTRNYAAKKAARKAAQKVDEFIKKILAKFHKQ